MFIAACYKPLSFWTSSNCHSRSAYFAYKLPECYLSLSKLLYPRCVHPTCISDREQRQLIQVHTHISETNSVSITSFKVQLNSQSNCNFSPCRCVQYWKAVYSVKSNPWRYSSSRSVYRLCTVLLDRAYSTIRLYWVTEDSAFVTVWLNVTDRTVQTVCVV